MSTEATEVVPGSPDHKEHRGRRGKVKELTEELTSLRVERQGLEETVAELTERVAQLEEDRLRLMAEMDNMHKRAQRRLQEDRFSLLLEITKPLLDVADNLQRAGEVGDPSGVEHATKAGIRMVHDQLIEVLSRYGVEPIDAVGQPFDFNVHEAIAHAPSDGASENDVIAEVSKGYLLNGRLLRPSKVVVARNDDRQDG